MLRAGSWCVVALCAAVVWSLSATSAGAATSTIGGPGVGNGTFDVPGADAVDSSGDLYVLDPHRGTLQKFSNTGSFIASISSANAIDLSQNDLGGIAVDSSNNVLVADDQNTRLIELDSSLAYTRTIDTGFQFVAVAAGDGFIYTLDFHSGNYEIRKYNDGPSYSLVQSRVFSGGTDPGDLAAPENNAAIHDQLAVGPDGTVYITDAANQRVIELSGSDLTTALTPTLTGFTGYPQGIAVGSVGGVTQVYVGDDNYAGTASVKRFSTSGTLLGSLAVPGAHGGLATDASGNVFDSEGFGNGAVLRIDTTPDPAIAPTPSTGLSSQTVSFSGAGSETDLWGVADYRWDLDGSGTFATDTATVPTVSRQFNAPGTYAIGLRVTATNGRVAQTTLNYVVGNSLASFIGPSQTLTNVAAGFDASASAIPYSSVTDYAWDFDGSGSYAVDGGNSPTISHTFATPGTYNVQLRVTRAGGRVDTASGTIIVTPDPPPGAVGVSIDNGDYATDDPHVTLDLVWPSAASQVLISDDGGFGAAGDTMTLPLSAQVPWTLEESGPERLPKTVYLRFLGAGIDDQNFTDDIILDQTPPTLDSAQLVTGGLAHTAAARTRPRLRRFEIKVVARDMRVGVCAVAASPRRTGGSTVTVRKCRVKGITRLDKTVTIEAVAQPKYVRVRNSAGTWSRWLTLGS